MNGLEPANCDNAQFVWSKTPDTYLHRCVKSPFQVGARIRNENNHLETAVVTELTESGFKYKLDEPKIYTRPFWGKAEGGEVFCRHYYPGGGYELVP